MKIRSAFTLIEVILAIAVGAIVLCAASSYLFSLTQLYSSSAGASELEEHADNITEWIYESLMASKAEGKGGQVPVYWFSESGFYDGRSMLAFNLTADAPIPAGPLPAMSPLMALLFFTEDGGLWIATRPQAKSNLNPKESTESTKVFFTPLSPYVKSIAYRYYNVDNNEWSEQTSDPEKLPIFFDLKFDNEIGAPITRRVVLPTLPAGLTKATAQDESTKNKTDKKKNKANKKDNKNAAGEKNGQGSANSAASKGGSASAKPAVSGASGSVSGSTAGN